VTHARAAGVAVLLLLLGAGTGVATVALHSRWWGLALAAPAVVAGLLALPRRWSTRPAFAVGWLVLVLRLGLAGGPGGDVVVAANTAGYALLLLALVVALATLLTLPRRRSVTSAGSGPAP
jgi:hypothetical protein